jgi:hypothetical protein
VSTATSPENQKRADEFEQKLAEHEETEAAEKAQVAKIYNPREACRRSSEIRIVQDELLGEVRFGVLSIVEFTDLRLSDLKDENARTRKIIHAMLKKADPELTIEQVEAIPFDEFTILNGILGQALPGFLRLAKQALNSGSARTQTPKSSG